MNCIDRLELNCDDCGKFGCEYSNSVGNFCLHCWSKMTYDEMIERKKKKAT